MNKHIELVKKWLNDPESVTQEELNANVDAAGAVSVAWSAATEAAWCAAYAAADVFAADAARWVERYEEMTNES